jgi:hypothetical protein
VFCTLVARKYDKSWGFCVTHIEIYCCIGGGIEIGFVCVFCIVLFEIFRLLAGVFCVVCENVWDRSGLSGVLLSFDDRVSSFVFCVVLVVVVVERELWLFDFSLFLFLLVISS